MQIFLQGKLLGVEDFLLAPAGGERDHAFTGRSHWVSLLGEILPRALLAELGLAKILLGSSGGGQFLVLLPDEMRASADAFLTAAAREIAALSDGVVKLIWSVTENLGDWSDVRKRLHDQMSLLRGTPAAGLTLEDFALSGRESANDAELYFASQLGWKLRDAESVGWSPETPGRIIVSDSKTGVGEGKHVWSLTGSQESLPFRAPCRAQ